MRRPPDATRAACPATGGGPTGPPTFDAARFATLCRELPELGTKLVVFTGGEPLVREDVFEIADLFRAQGMEEDQPAAPGAQQKKKKKTRRRPAPSLVWPPTDEALDSSSAKSGPLMRAHALARLRAPTVLSGPSRSTRRPSTAPWVSGKRCSARSRRMSWPRTTAARLASRPGSTNAVTATL